jgi:hypothetical protein
MKPVLVILLILCTGPAHSQDTSSIEFAQVYYKKAWRIIDKQGNFILNQEYGVGSYQSLCFTDKLAVSFKNGKYGFTDFSNNQVIPNKFDAVHCFVLGYAPASVNKKWGIINKMGKFVVEPIYDYVGIFGLENVAPVIKDNKIGLVDTTGRLVVPFKYYWRSSMFTIPDYPMFMHGLITVIDAKDPDNIHEGKWACMNTKGELVVPANYDYIGYFVDGIASAKKGDGMVLLDTLGNVLQVLKGIDNGSLFFDINGFSVFYKTGAGMGVIKKSGEIILEPKYNGVEPFSEGFAAVQISGDENGVVSGFIDSTGQFVFGRRFGHIKNFEDGHAAVQIDGKWGFIDRSGKLVIENKFDEVIANGDGLAVVGIKKGKTIKYGFIDYTGKFVLPAIYNDAFLFDCGLAPVKLGKKYGYIDRSGKFIIPPKFDNAFAFSREIIGW